MFWIEAPTPKHYVRKKMKYWYWSFITNTKSTDDNDTLFCPKIALHITLIVEINIFLWARSSIKKNRRRCCKVWINLPGRLILDQLVANKTGSITALKKTIQNYISQWYVDNNVSHIVVNTLETLTWQNKRTRVSKQNSINIPNWVKKKGETLTCSITCGDTRQASSRDLSNLHTASSVASFKASSVITTAS